MVAHMNNVQFFLEFTIPEKAKWVMESERRWFRGGSLKLEWWSPEAGCMKSLEIVEKSWIKVVGLHLHLWRQDVLKMIGGNFGGFLSLYKETALRTKVLWGILLVKTEGKMRPIVVNILEGSRSFELQIWWKLPP